MAIRHPKRAYSASYRGNKIFAVTHHIPVVGVDSPVDLGTAAEEDIPVAEVGLAGMPPAAGHIEHYL